MGRNPTSLNTISLPVINHLAAKLEIGDVLYAAYLGNFLHAELTRIELSSRFYFQEWAKATAKGL